MQSLQRYDLNILKPSSTGTSLGIAKSSCFLHCYCSGAKIMDDESIETRCFHLTEILKLRSSKETTAWDQFLMLQVIELQSFRSFIFVGWFFHLCSCDLYISYIGCTISSTYANFHCVFTCSWYLVPTTHYIIVMVLSLLSFYLCRQCVVKMILIKEVSINRKLGRQKPDTWFATIKLEKETEEAGLIYTRSF